MHGRGPRVAPLIAALLVATGGGAGCEDEEPPGGERPAGGGAADGPAFIAALCEAYAPCCRTAGATDCRAAVTGLVGSRAFDPERARACLEDVRKGAAGATFCTEPPEGASCSAVFKHPRARDAGGPCVRASDCANGPEGDGVCIDATCRRVTRGKQGDPCLGTRIAARLERIERPPAPSAAICVASDGLYCDDETARCAARAAIGASCTPGRDTSCVDEAWCPAATQQCVARTPPGSPCTDAYECAAAAQCVNDGEGGGACASLAEKGEPCVRGDECNPRSGLVCDADATVCAEDVSIATNACSGSLALL
jgi:hypothetical protein